MTNRLHSFGSALVRAMSLATIVASGFAMAACPAPAPTPEEAPALPDLREPPPADATSFLAALSPMPSESLVITYVLTGPGGIEGDLEILVGRGGYQRENWHLVVPGAGETPTEVRGTRIRTPAEIWSAVDGASGEIVSAPHQALADAYLALDEEKRRKVIEGIESWQADLDAARDGAPGEIDEVAGQPCLKTHVAAQTLCLWERTGLPLRYQGDQFGMTAARVDLDAKIAPAAFDLPPEAKDAKRIDGTKFDAEAEIAALAEHRYAGLALMITSLPIMPASGPQPVPTPAPD